MAGSRREARETLFELVFQFLFLGEKDTIAYKEMQENTAISAETKAFITHSYEGICKKHVDLTAIIAANVKDFSPSQVFKPDYAIMLIASFEMLEDGQSPAIAINEAIELAKKFSTDKSSSFVNGVLSSIAKTV